MADKTYIISPNRALAIMRKEFADRGPNLSGNVSIISETPTTATVEINDLMIESQTETTVTISDPENTVTITV